MFIRLENNQAEHVIEADSYTVVRDKGPKRVLVWPKDGGRSKEYILTPEPNKDWQRYYVMNSDGRTIDRGHATPKDDG